MFKKIVFLFVLTLCTTSAFSQSYEGSITYKMEALNPMPERIPDSTWKKGIVSQFGARGYMLQKYYYKKDKYISVIDAGKQSGFQAYSPADKTLYAWQKGSDTAVTTDTRKNADELIEITDSDKRDTILGFPCRSVIVKSKAGQMTLWYDPAHFQIDAGLYAGHKYGHWEQILKRTGCLPLKMEQKGFMTRIVQTAIEYKQGPVDDKQFLIPQFKKTITSP